MRVGALDGDAERCVDLWLDALAARDGQVESLAVGDRVREKFTRQILRFAVVGCDIEGFFPTLDCGDGLARLEMLAMAPHTPLCGGGRALLADALGWAEESRHTRFELQVRAGNVKAIHLYESAGLGQVGTVQVHPFGGRPMLTFGTTLA